MKKGLKKLLSVILSAVMVSSVMICGYSVSAANGDSDVYEIYNDGYGYLTANFPSEYPSEYLDENPSESEIQYKIDALMQTLTYDEKVSMLAADGIMGWDTSAMTVEKSYGTGYWEGVARVGIPVIRNYDGPMGSRGNAGYETSRPANELSVASSFDTDVAYEYGQLYARDNKANAGNMQLGIQTDLIRKLSTSRARDMFGEDWYLEGTIGSAMASGLEDGHVLACLKHVGGLGNIDEQTMMENYMSVYEIILKEDNSAHTIMTNYEPTNGQQACADRYVLKQVIRNMWNWKGITLTDWGGNYQFTVDDGITMETPSGTYNNAENIAAALEAGTITMEDIDSAVENNLYALGKAGYLGMVAVSRDGTAAVDSTPPEQIELPDATDEERAAIQEANVQTALETSEAGVVLLKNENSVLPLNNNSGSIALIGLGSTYTVAGHMHECAFGVLDELAVSPYDALTELMPESDINAYVAQDVVGTPIPAEYLYTDAEATINGVIRTGTDGYGVEDNGTDADINFITNSTDYKNAEDGTAFPYGEQGVNYTWKTYLKAPETGTYTLKVEAIGASAASGSIIVNEETKNISSAKGDLGVGGWGSTGTVTSKTGLDIPNGTSVELEAGKVYEVTVTVNGNLDEKYDYLMGKKDTQISLAWITPSEKTNNYSDAINAAATADTVVLFAHSLESLSIDSSQSQLITDSIAAAKEAGNKVVLVLSTALPVNITSWVEDCDAIVELWLPGQSGGKVAANILSGAYNPSAKLCVTWPSNFNDDQGTIETSGRGDILKEGGSGGFGPGGGGKYEVKEGIYNGYKWYDATDKDESVLYDFGHGLSYTDFEYELVSVEPAATGTDEYGYDVTVKVTNTGSVAGSDAVQLYVAAPEEGLVENAIYSPYDVESTWRYVYEDGTEYDYAAEGNSYKNAAYFVEIDGVQFAEIQLAAYDHTDIIEPGASETVTMHVSQRAFSYWDEDADYTERADGTLDKWTTVEGNRTLYVAKSSDNLVIEETVDVKPVEYKGEVTATAQESADVNEIFRVTVETPEDVIGLKLVNESGKTITIKDLTKETKDGKVTWNVYTAVGTAGEGREISIYTKTFDGWKQEADTSIIIDIISPDVEVLSAVFAKEVVKVNEAVETTVISSGSTRKLAVYNENNGKMGTKQIAKTVNSDGTIEWKLSMSFGSKGSGKVYTFNAIGANGEFGVSAARAAINVI